MNNQTIKQQNVAMERFALAASDLGASSHEALGCPARKIRGSDPSGTVV